MNPLKEGSRFDQTLTRRQMFEGLIQRGKLVVPALTLAACGPAVLPASTYQPDTNRIPSAPPAPSAPPVPNASLKKNQTPIPSSPEQQLEVWGLSLWENLLNKTQKTTWATFTVSVVNPDVMNKVHERILRSIPNGPAAPAAPSTQEMEDTVKIKWNAYFANGIKWIGEAELKRISMGATNTAISGLDKEKGVQLQGRVDIGFRSRSHSSYEKWWWPDHTSPEFQKWRNDPTPRQTLPDLTPADWQDTEGYEVMLYRDSNGDRKIYPLRNVQSEMNELELPAPFFRSCSDIWGCKEIWVKS